MGKERLREIKRDLDREIPYMEGEESDSEKGDGDRELERAMA